MEASQVSRSPSVSRPVPALNPNITSINFSYCHIVSAFPPNIDRELKTGNGVLLVSCTSSVNCVAYHPTFEFPDRRIIARSEKKGGCWFTILAMQSVQGRNPKISYDTKLQYMGSYLQYFGQWSLSLCRFVIKSPDQVVKTKTTLR